MARGDSITSLNNQIGASARLAIQPASGDEWVVTSLIMETAVSPVINPNSDTAANNIGGWGSVSAPRTDLSEAHCFDLKFFMDNSNYIRMHNAYGGTAAFGFTGIKMKE